MEQNLCIVGYTVEDSFMAWEQRKKNFSGVGYNGKKAFALWDSTKGNLANILKLFFGVFHTGGETSSIVSTPEKKSLPLDPKTEENLFRFYPTPE
jgi:hypothetical protein